METDPRPTGARPGACPLCAFKAAYENSDVAQHVRGVQRESLLLMRSLLNAAIQCAEGQLCSRHRAAAERPPADGAPPA